MAVAVKNEAVAASNGAVALPFPVHRFSVGQYHRMIETGILSEQDRVELLKGWIVDKMPQHPSHAGTISIVQDKVTPNLPKGWIIRVQSPITLDDSEPEPDLAIVEGPPERYLSSHPDPEDIGLLIEVSDTTLEYDREYKGVVYAEAHVPFYWIVNLMETKVEIYSDPGPARAPRYRKREDFGLEQSVPLIIAGKRRRGIAVAHLFP